MAILNLRCTNVTLTSLTIEWEYASSNKGFEIRWWKSTTSRPSSPKARVTKGGITGYTYDITGLSARTSYEIEVAEAYTGDSAQITVATIPPLATPTGITHDQVTSSSARVGWNAVTNATDYKVEYRQSGATDWTED